MQRNLRNFFLIAGLLVNAIFLSGAQDTSNKLYTGKWNFNEGQGNLLKDSSGNRNDGKIIKPEWIKGESRNVLHLGNGSYIEIPDSQKLNLQGALSIEMWISFSGRKNNGWNSIIIKGSDEKGLSYGLRELPNHLYFVLFGDKAGKRTYWCWNIKHNYYQDGRFHHVVVTYNGLDSVKFYVDGKRVPILTQMRGDYPEKISPSNDSLYIGKSFNGFIGSMAISNRALSYEKIESDYKQNKRSYSEINLAKTKPVQEIREYSFQQWRGQFNPEWRTGISFLWWYGEVEVFHDENANIEISREAYPTFQITCKGKGDGIYGIQFPWIAPLKKGFIYKFTLGVNSATLPDTIAVDENIVWEKDKGTVNPGKENNSIITFNYIPAQDKSVEVKVIRKCPNRAQNKLIFPAARSCDYLRAWKAVYKGDIPVYKKLDLKNDLLIKKIDHGIACKMHPENADEPIEYQKESLDLEKLPYETSTLVIMPIRPAVQYLKMNGIKGVNISHSWINKDTELIPVLQKENIKHICLVWGNIGIFLNSKKYDEIVKRTKEIVNAAKQYLREIPDCQIYILFTEDTGFCYGTWPHGIKSSPILYLPQYKDKISAKRPDVSDYDNMEWWPRRKVFTAFPIIQDYLAKFYKDIKDKIGDNNRIHIMLLADKPAYQPAHLYKAGVDIVMNKHIHKQNINVTTATNRGESLAYGKKYAFDCDFWDRMYPPKADLEEIAQALKVYFYAGGSYFWDEIPIITRAKNEFSPNAKISRIGGLYNDFSRYAAAHVKLGEQKSKIGIMRGSGGEWGIGCIAAPTSGESQPLGAEWKRRLFRDFNLLNVVFPNYGNYYRTFTDRLCTGTPYGPVNMIPWDISLDKLKKYKVVLFFGGPNAMNDKQYENLKKYVENGGVLVMAVGQLRKEDGTFYKSDVSDLFGVKLGETRRLHYPMRESLITEDPKEYPYTHLDLVGKNAEVNSRLIDSSPWVVKNRLGQGKAYLFSTEHLVQYGDAPAIDIMKSELEKTKWLTFSPESSWLEYMVQKKGDCYILPIFNHGNVGFPSGNGRKTGPWQGKVTLDLSKFEFPKGELAVYESVYVPDEKIPYKLVKIDSTQEKDTLSFNVKIDKFLEIVIGKINKVKNEYFESLNKKINNPEKNNNEL